MSIYPTIIIPGIGQSKIDMIDGAGNKIQRAWPISYDFQKALADLKGPLAKMMIFRKDAGFSDKIADMVSDAIEPLKLNSDGSNKHTLRAVSYNKPVSECTANEKRFIYTMVPMEQLAEETGEDKLYFYAFNPFGDAYETAKGLDEFVHLVKEQTGSEKVNFLAVSLGGVVLRAYLHKYSHKNDVSKIACIVAALDGTQAIADVYENLLSVTDTEKLLSLAGNKVSALAPILKMLPSEVINNIADKALSLVKNEVIYRCSLMWGCIPNNRFENISTKYLKNADPVLKEKVESFYQYSKTFGDRIKELQSQGVKFAFLCGYGRKMLPLVNSENENSDSIINISSASYGATSAKFGEKLSVTGEYVSPDGTVDASTCVLKDNVWFFYNQQHDNIAYNDVALAVAQKFLTGEIEDIHSDEKYPQFNNTRNIYAIKKRRLPEAQKVLSSGNVTEADKAEIERLIAKYEEILSNTITKDNSEIDSLNNEFKAVLEKYK